MSNEEPGTWNPELKDGYERGKLNRSLPIVIGKRDMTKEIRRLAEDAKKKS